MAEDQKKTQKDCRAFFEGTPCADMVRKMMAGKKEGQTFNCAEISQSVGASMRTLNMTSATRRPAPEKALGISSDLCYAAALRGECWKYVHFAGLPAMLFDLQNDPHEMRNLAGDPAHQGVMLAMAQELLSHRMAHADRTLTSHFIDEAGLHQHHEPRY